MKTSYIVYGIIIISLVITGILFTSSPRLDKPPTPGKNDVLITSTPLLPAQEAAKPISYTLRGLSGPITISHAAVTDETTAITLAEKAINLSSEAEYKFECLIVDSVKNGATPRQSNGLWSVIYRCNDACATKYINCSAAVAIDNSSHSITIGYPN